MDDPKEDERAADLAAARGDFAIAQSLLEQVVRTQQDNLDAWIKLAAMRRARRDIEGALEATFGALRIDPLGFMPLLLKAGLLDMMERHGDAREAFAAALFHAPSSEDVSPALADHITAARRRHATLVAEQSAKLDRAIAGSAIDLDAAERRRVDRFRDNMLRVKTVFHSEPTHFHYPGLREREFHDRDDFPWLSKLEAATSDIVGEFHAVAAAERAEIVPYIQYPEDLPLRQWAALNHSHEWRAIHLIRNGEVIDATARHCPRTMALLDSVPLARAPGRSPNVMFSLLEANAHIPPHNGVANTRLVCHLPLILPDNCWFRVGAETRYWEEGVAWVFDDTIEHEARNESSALRVLLIIDVWHPDLSSAEQAAIAAMLAAHGDSASFSG